MKWLFKKREKVKIEGIRVLRLEEGDTLVFSVSGRYSGKSVCRYLKGEFPNNKVLVLTEDCRLEVVLRESKYEKVV